MEYEVFLCDCEACIPAPSISTPISEAQVLILSKLSFFLKVAIRYTTSLNSNGPTVNLSLSFHTLNSSFLFILLCVPAPKDVARSDIVKIC